MTCMHNQLPCVGASGQSPLLRACASGTSKCERRLVVAQVRVLVFDLGSTTPFLKDEFQVLRLVITARVVNDEPVWSAMGGVLFMYRCDGGHTMISDAKHCAEGSSNGLICSERQNAGSVAPTDLPSGKWLSQDSSTLNLQYASARKLPGNVWVLVPGMRITVAHRLDDGNPTMAAAFQQLAAHS